MWRALGTRALSHSFLNLPSRAQKSIFVTRWRALYYSIYIERLSISIDCLIKWEVRVHARFG